MGVAWTILVWVALAWAGTFVVALVTILIGRTFFPGEPVPPAPRGDADVAHELHELERVLAGRRGELEDPVAVTARRELNERRTGGSRTHASAQDS